MRLDAVSAQLGALAWPLKDAVLLNEALKPHATGAKKSVPLNLRGDGSFSAEQFRLSGQWADLSAEPFTPWLQALIPGHIRGNSTGRAGLLVAGPLEAKAAARVELALRDLSLKDFSLAALQPSSAKPSLPPLLRLASLNLDGLKLSLATLHARAGEMLLMQAAPIWHTAVMGCRATRRCRRPPARRKTPPLPPPRPPRSEHVGQQREPARRLAVSSAALSTEQIRLRVQNRKWPMAAGSMSVSLALLSGAP